MKRILPLFILALGLLGACQNEQTGLSTDLVTNPKSASQPSDRQAIITFDKTEHNFGRLLQGEVVTYTFHFTNTGNTPLIITGVGTSCGCTAGDYPREPIAPGKSGDIKATYDSKGHNGFQHRTLTVTSNTIPNQTTLDIKAEVVKPDQF